MNNSTQDRARESAVAFLQRKGLRVDARWTDMFQEHATEQVAHATQELQRQLATEQKENERLYTKKFHPRTIEAAQRADAAETQLADEQANCARLRERLNKAERDVERVYANKFHPRTIEAIERAVAAEERERKLREALRFAKLVLPSKGCATAVPQQLIDAIDSALSQEPATSPEIVLYTPDAWHLDKMESTARMVSSMAKRIVSFTLNDKKYTVDAQQSETKEEAK